MDSHRGGSPGGRAEPWIVLALCAAVVLGWAAEQLVPDLADDVRVAAPGWLPLAAAVFATAGIMRLGGSPRWLRVHRALLWGGLLLMVWAANGLPFDVLTMAGLIGHQTASGAMVMSSVYWPGLVTRSLALATAVMLARLALERPVDPATRRVATWYGYAAFGLALPYPLLRLHWALGGTVGLMRPGAAGEGFAPLAIAVPFILAAVLSLLLASPRRWMPRRPMLAAGWSATAVLAMVGPGACWTMLSTFARGGGSGADGIEVWVFCLFYGSWLLWAIAGGAATRSYQLRSAARTGGPGPSRRLRQTGQGPARTGE